MALPSGFIPPTGKTNAIASFNKFLVSEIPDGFEYDGISTELPIGKEFWWFFDYPLTSLQFPSISIHEAGLFSEAPRAMGRALDWDSDTGQVIQGDRNQTLLEINCWDSDTTSEADATITVRKFRDRINYVLKNAGKLNENTDTLIVPSITIKDYTQVGEPEVGRLFIDNADNAIDEKYIVDVQDRNIKRYRLLVRVYWDELVV